MNDLMIDKKYIEAFDKFSSYYMEIAKDEFQKVHINRKIEHCKRVNKLAVDIAKRMGLSDNAINLISIASLFHDIGRFKQFYLYSTYIDKISCNHALLSIDMLEEENVLVDLDDESRRIVLDIIKLHNCKELGEDISKEMYTYASIIRDSDKIDWIYAMINIIPSLSKENQAVFYSCKEDKNYVSMDLVDSILNNKMVSSIELTTIDEVRLASMGWITSGMKCIESYEIIRREDLINKTFNLISDSNEKNIIFNYINEYVKNNF